MAHVWMVDEVRYCPLEHSGGGFNTGSKDVPHSHEEVIVTEACSRRVDVRRVVVLGAAFGSQQGVQQVSLDVVTVVCLGDGEESVCNINTHIFHSMTAVGRREVVSLREK